MPSLKLYTIPEVADCCRVTTSLVYRWIQERKLDAVQLGVGGIYRVTEEALYRFLGLPCPDTMEAPEDPTLEEAVAYARHQAKLAGIERERKRREASCARKTKTKTRGKVSAIA